MKKTLTMLALLAGAVSGYSQGQVVFTDYSGVLEQQIFNSQTTAPSGASLVTVSNGGFTTTEYVGSSTGSVPAGNAVFAANTALSGTGFDAQLYAAAGTGDSLGSLVAQGGISHFNTGTGAGFVKGTPTVTLVGILGGTPSTFAIAAWAATGADGAAATLALAQADGYAWGFSTTGSFTPSTSPATPPLLPNDVEGFSLTSTAVTPEPSTIALGVMGASAFLFRRRK